MYVPLCRLRLRLRLSLFLVQPRYSDVSDRLGLEQIWRELKNGRRKVQEFDIVRLLLAHAWAFDPRTKISRSHSSANHFVKKLLLTTNAVAPGSLLSCLPQNTLSSERTCFSSLSPSQKKKKSTCYLIVLCTSWIELYFRARSRSSWLQANLLSNIWQTRIFSFHTCSRQSHIMVHGCLNQSGWHARSFMVQTYPHLAVSTESFQLLLHQLRTSFFDTSMRYFLNFHMQAICACICLCVHERCPKLVLAGSVYPWMHKFSWVKNYCTCAHSHAYIRVHRILPSSNQSAHGLRTRLRVLQNHSANHSMIMPMWCVHQLWPNGSRQEYDGTIMWPTTLQACRGIVSVTQGQKHVIAWNRIHHDKDQ